MTSGSPHGLLPAGGEPMSLEPIHVAPVAEKVEPPPAQLTTPEQVRAADQLFATQQREEAFVSGLLGLYTGTLLLRDLAAEHLSREEKEQPRLPKDEPPEN